MLLTPPEHRPLSGSDPLSWHLLARLPGIGPQRWQALLDNLDDPATLFNDDAHTLRSMGLPPEARRTVQAWQSGDHHHDAIADALRDHSEAQRLGLTVLTRADPRYPASLEAIHAAPPLLYVRGDPDWLSRPQVAIVGARKATRAGLDHARQFARVLAERGWVVTSGLALGVDGHAHQGALEGGGGTLAVLGTGADVPYPKAHGRLRERIVEQGALVSEFPPGTRPHAGHFPRRNRLISGLSQGVLVVEAGLRSGSLITARLALEQGREVFAVPGAIHNPQARGCHQLIRQGAALVESVDDIEAELSEWWQPANTPEPAPAPTPAIPDHLEARERQVLSVMETEASSTDQLCDRTGLDADQLMQAILLLEMEGLVRTVPGGFERT
ncbi:DNA protecting protein DprA [Tamilnaduibacter salinus]|uniref:DNA protecting protein DprA n=1 Tax=Tamilnaduibacter salinus TaxID=1484056 RepID=A0A2U1CY91_9GAMM|nr:DNA-processing protein DprA [Tamilnaduibacter salinus]PVY77449.1 DNA protecting protein DprA [Tamilnaduibacter salinus]